MKKTQIILYNQLRGDYLQNNTDSFLYMHHIGKINFQGRELQLNNYSKILDYAGGKHMVEVLQKHKKQADFILTKSFFSGLMKYSKEKNITHFILVKPVENYVYQNFLKIQKELEKQNITLEILPDTYSFFLSNDEFIKQYKKPPIMEYFYRFMRKKHNILIDENGKPEGGKWNYDKDNRKFDKNHTKSWNFSLEKNKHILEAEAYYNYIIPLHFQPSNRSEALELLDYFVDHHLDNFGKLEDAMYEEDNFVHHSMLSTSINFGLLSPHEVVEKIKNTDTAMNNKEGFIRQILGWREYMYHFFECYKDTIYTENHLGHTRPLPAYFWKNAELCEINSLKQTLKHVQKYNFSHHIQRLMIIGNFALLTNLDPHELNHWFFEYYTDAFEWVVTPNVLGMSQFADGGKLATKPYVASANYINKMSNYYKNSHHNPKEKYTDDACPFNYLYWVFVADNKEIFEKGRQQFVLKNLEKVDIERCRELKEKFVKQ